jgi:hypothetical protein
MRPTFAKMAGGNGEAIWICARAVSGADIPFTAVNLDPALVRYASMSPFTWTQ